MRAGSGEEAIDALKELAEKGQPVALILSDQRMPRLNGTQVLEQARVLHPEARRVLLTAYADTGAAIAAINSSQVHYYLVKPWNPPEEKFYPTLNDQLEDWKSHCKSGYDGLKIIGSRWSEKVTIYTIFCPETRFRTSFSRLKVCLPKKRSRS